MGELINGTFCVIPRNEKCWGHQIQPRVGKEKIGSDERIALTPVERNKVIGGDARNTYGIDFRDLTGVVPFSR